MFPRTAATLPNSLLSWLARAYAPARDRGLLLDGVRQHPVTLRFRTNADTTPASIRDRTPTGDLTVALFVNRLRQLLAANTEQDRRELEKEVLRLAVPLQAAGIFDVVKIAHPALASMVTDHLAEQDARRTRCSA